MAAGEGAGLPRREKKCFSLKEFPGIMDLKYQEMCVGKSQNKNDEKCISVHARPVGALQRHKESQTLLSTNKHKNKDAKDEVGIR